MNRHPDRLVCPAHDRCQSPACGDIIGNLPALVYLNENTGQSVILHVMCAPPHVRKAYHEAQHVG